MPDPQPDAIAPEPFVAPAADGFPVRGFAWRHRSPAAGRPVTVINCATSVRCRYYFRFAAYLFRHGSDVLVYDYRGIGESRPASLAGFHASWLDWGRLDCDAVLQYASRTFCGPARRRRPRTASAASRSGSRRRIRSCGARSRSARNTRTGAITRARIGCGC